MKRQCQSSSMFFYFYSFPSTLYTKINEQYAKQQEVYSTLTAQVNSVVNSMKDMKEAIQSGLAEHENYLSDYKKLVNEDMVMLSNENTEYTTKLNNNIDQLSQQLEIQSTQCSALQVIVCFSSVILQAQMEALKIQLTNQKQEYEALLYTRQQQEDQLELQLMKAKV